jgi:hypothetical protein
MKIGYAGNHFRPEIIRQTFWLPFHLALNENVEDGAIVIDGAPKPALLAADRDGDFIQTPFVSSPMPTIWG